MIEPYVVRCMQAIVCLHDSLQTMKLMHALEAMPQELDAHGLRGCV